jgi:hypothetical protein
MARMIPAEPLSFHGSAAEEEVFAALKGLAPDVTVFHSVRWVREGPTASGRPMGEADFVVLDPQHGLLFLEVKGGAIRLEAGQWYQRCAGAEWKPIDPEEQARHSMHTLRRRIAARLPVGDHCPCGHAVWFPQVEAPRTGLPPSITPAMLLDRRALQAPAVAVRAAFNHWDFGEARLSEAGRRRILEVLAPTLDLAPTLQVECDARERRFVQLTEEQARILDFLDAQRVATIAGSAGTGKTLLAMEKARRLGAEGGRVLFLCYNATLRRVLQRQAPASGVDYHTFHSLARRFSGREGDAFEAQVQAFLTHLADDANDWPYDHVLIDEGQDFESDWIQWLEHRTGGTFYVFYDRHQLVQQARMPAWVEEAECRLTLHRNCRNTNQIARMAWRAGSVPVARGLGSVDGPRPVLHEHAGRDAIVRRVRDLVVRLRREGLAVGDIAILSPLGAEQAALAGVASLADVPLTDEPEPGAICRTTVRKFKGLEAKVVLMTDVDLARLADPELRRLLYVGCSRARHALHLFVPAVDESQVAALLETLAPGRRLLASRRVLAEQLAAEWEDRNAAEPKQRR